MKFSLLTGLRSPSRNVFSKKIFIMLAAVFAAFSAQSQAPSPVKWIASYKSISATEGEISITAVIDKGWHIYSQDTTSAGPIPTSFTFPKSKEYSLVGKTEETGAHKIFDKAFEANVSSFSEKGLFRQKIKLNAKPGFTLAFQVEYMCCDDNMCLPPKTVDLSVKVQ
jgi:thiol:disulfide interchange protein DsbD